MFNMEQALLNFDSPHLLSDEEAVLSCLGHGRQAATSSKEITRRTGIGERRIQQVVNTMIMKRGILIGTATTKPPGYFIPVTQDELVESSRPLRSRAIKILARAARITRRAMRMEFDQGCLEQEDE
jgi:hypothetical protein